MDELSNPKKRRPSYQLLVLAALLVLGILAQRLELVDWLEVLEASRHYAHHWWFPPLIILAMVVFYALALPGSFFMWLAGALFVPVVATVLIVIGGVGGAVGGYFLSRRLSRHESARLRHKPLFNFIRRHGDFVALCAVRIFPSFPHSVINYGAGILGLPLRYFVLSTVVGFVIKGYLYSAAIYQLTTMDEPGEFLSWQLLAPLLLLSALFIAAKLIFGRKPALTNGSW
ncbi:TVP38/TMEM64 family protein [Desulfurivibrio dismutans]|uniref:TVP38/TMEM64 family protein n=1 Tax=Desulfurivibrio dismutans TaxID=1398908 RepID=UPI0023DBCED4|nr:VTT domain-containing protein [Desulfurivibrio alkaliphilus]MDF1613873.1 VTT domain-containing protein [Desulfurivibrio alkaliphilus]